MVYYTVSPNKDRTAWFLKHEDFTPEQTFDKYDDAVDAAYKEARDNQPSTLTIIDEAFHIKETQVFR